MEVCICCQHILALRWLEQTVRDPSLFTSCIAWFLLSLSTSELSELEDVPCFPSSKHLHLQDTSAKWEEEWRRQNMKKYCLRLKLKRFHPSHFWSKRSLQTTKSQLNLGKEPKNIQIKLDNMPSVRLRAYSLCSVDVALGARSYHLQGCHWQHGVKTLITKKHAFIRATVCKLTSHKPVNWQGELNCFQITMGQTNPKCPWWPQLLPSAGAQRKS